MSLEIPFLCGQAIPITQCKGYLIEAKAKIAGMHEEISRLIAGLDAIADALNK